MDIEDSSASCRIHFDALGEKIQEQNACKCYEPLEEQ